MIHICACVVRTPPRKGGRPAKINRAARGEGEEEEDTDEEEEER